jgi:TM2 domain-containing membrane protein YozV
MRGGAAPATMSEKRVATGTNPVLATILSFFIPGVGQFINGDTKKGAVMLVLAIVLLVPTVGVGWLAMQIWSAVDAYRVATGTAQRW